MNIKKELKCIDINYKDMFFNNIEIAPEKIYAVMINEVVPAKEKDDFYGDLNADYFSTAIALFQKAGINVNCVNQILDLGIYITNTYKN